MTQQELPGTEAFGPREAMEYDVVIVGAGPSGRRRYPDQTAGRKSGQDFSVCVLEKGSEPGAHILSGAVMDPVALSELFPDWKTMGAPVTVPVSEDRFLFLGEKIACKTPEWMLPKAMRNKGNYVVSLAILYAGWHNRRKSSVWTFSPDSPPQRCSMVKTVWSGESPQAIWGWEKTENRPVHSSREWSFMHAIPCLRKEREDSLGRADH